MASPLPRFLDEHAERAAWERKLARILLETGADLLADVRRSSSANGGDRRALRGLPAIGRGCGSGGMAGTDPLEALLDKEERSA